MVMPRSPITRLSRSCLIIFNRVQVVLLRQKLGPVLFKRNTFGILLIAVLSLCCGSLALAQTVPMPELSFKNRTGGTESLSLYRGKIVVLNFWATWCLPCREELPMLDKLAAKFPSDQVVFFAVSLDTPETQPKIDRFLGKKKISLPIWLGASTESLKQLNLGEVIPATVIFDRNGEIVMRILGEASRKDITSRLDWLLSERTTKAPKPVSKNY
jgi:thiol-disulfide isomerase/thioredoxin